MAYKIRFMIQLLDGDEVQRQTSVLSPDYPNEERCHKGYIELAGGLIKQMERTAEAIHTEDEVYEELNKEEEDEQLS